MGTDSHTFITGGTGFIGRFVVQNLLTRGHTVYLLLRIESRKTRDSVLCELSTHAAQSDGTLHLIDGDLTQPGLGLSPEDSALVQKTHQTFHLAAIYDLEADDTALQQVNVDGTEHLCSWLKQAGYSGLFHHISSIAVAGNYKGTFEESMFDEGQSHPHAYHQTKFESERVVRNSGLDYRIYRPGAVVGHSATGFIDKMDGIYYAFPAVAKASALLPSWFKIPLPHVRGGINVVPVDFVANALCHIAQSRTSSGQVFHLVDPSAPSITKLLNILLQAAGGPQLGKMPGKMRTPGPAKALSMLPIFSEIKTTLLDECGLPSEEIFKAMNLNVRYTDHNTQAALESSDIKCPSFKSYVKYLYRYYQDHLDPALHRPALYQEKLAGKTILITGASRGIGKETAIVAAKAGAQVILVARNSADLEEVKTFITEQGGQAHAFTADLALAEDIDQLAAKVLEQTGGVDILVHNAARSIRRPIAQSLERFHDFERTMQLNYFGPVRLTLQLLPSLLQRQGSAVMVLTLGVLMPGPFFGAYLPSKAALDIFGDVLASEHAHEGLHVASVYLPLVKTAMMAPTQEYAERVDLMTPTKAAYMILDSVAQRKRRVMLPVGRLFSLANRLAPGPTTRVLNLLRRTFPAPGETSEFPMEQAIVTQTIGGSPI